jgi:hypothetical protein
MGVDSRIGSKAAMRRPTTVFRLSESTTGTSTIGGAKRPLDASLLSVLCTVRS